MEHKGTKRIETERLILRPFQAEDAEAMFRNWASDKEVTKFLTWPAHESIEVSKQVAESWMKGNSDPKNYQWAIELKEIGEPIGSISTVQTDDRTESATIGYCIGKKWWGQGIVAEALRRVIAFFFEEVKMNCVNACHDPRNPNSGKVMKKCGMTYEGTWRAGGVNNEGVCDESWYSILKKEYEAGLKKGKTEIRFVQAEDKEFWYSLDKHLPESEFAGKVRDQRGYVLLYNGVPAGILRYNLFWDNTPFCTMLFIDENYQKKGFGRKLMEYWEADMKSRGYQISLVSTQADETAQNFYRRLGYKDCGGFVLDPAGYAQPTELLLAKAL